MDFAEDGTFTAERFPAGGVIGPVDRTTGSGSWSVEKRSPQESDEWLLLDFEEAEVGRRARTYFAFSSDDGHVVFRVLMGGPDNPKQVCHFSRQ